MESVRRFIRDRLGYQSPLYSRAAMLLNDGLLLLRDGIGTYLQIKALQQEPEVNAPAQAVHFRSLEHPLFLRPGTTDVSAAIQNIIRREYGRYAPKTPPSVLVDAGAYIGDTTAYFLNKFPGIRSYAIEPSLESMTLARKNLEPYGTRVSFIAAALNAQGGAVCFGGSDTGARIGGKDSLEVRAMTIPEVLALVPEGFIDILKLDIEGAEADIFANNPEQWMPSVGMIIVEPHGAEISKLIVNAMDRNGWTARLYRNLFYCWPNKTPAFAESR